MKLDADITVLVMSCDAYQDLWNPFFFYFHKHWPFQDTPILLVTDTIAETGNDSVRAVPIQGSWSTRLCGALRQVKTHYILLLLEDYFLSGPIDAVTFRQAAADCAKYHAATIRLLPGMKKFLTPPRNFFPYAEIPPHTPYRFSTIPGIWDTAYLMRLANTEYSAWDFERKGSFDMDAYEEPVLCADSIVVPYIHAVKRGKWLPEAVAANAENRLDIDYGKRAKQSRYDIFRQKVIDGIWQMCPRLIVSLQNKLGR